MKKMMLAVFMLTVLLAGCKDDDKPSWNGGDIVGKWEMTEVSILKIKATPQKDLERAFKESFKEVSKTMTMTVEFTADGKFTSVTTGEMLRTGTEKETLDETGTKRVLRATDSEIVEGTYTTEKGKLTMIDDDGERDVSEYMVSGNMLMIKDDATEIAKNIIEESGLAITGMKVDQLIIQTKLRKK